MGRWHGRGRRWSRRIVMRLEAMWCVIANVSVESALESEPMVY